MPEWMNSIYFIVSAKMLAATIVGGIIGYDRAKTGKAAGIKTHSMVCLGSSVIMIIGTLTAQMYQSDPTRLAAQVVSGIGFLCAGVIILTKSNEIKGLTTAAGLWLAACMGLCIGSDFAWVAIPASICYFLIARGFLMIENKYIPKQ